MKLLRRLSYVLVLLVAGFAYAYLFSFFQVEPKEQAIILTLGKVTRTLGEGPHFYFPPFEVKETRLLTVEREEFGFRTESAEAGSQEYLDQTQERHTLTGDENLVEVQFVVQWRITDLRDFMFNVQESRAVIRDVAEAAMREVVGQHPAEFVINEGRGTVRTEAELLMQRVLDDYGAGVTVDSVQLQEVDPPDEVAEAFRDVGSASQDKERAILEAQGYADQVVPKARGEAEERLNQARAYREQRILEARGDAVRFNALLVEYKKSPEVTRERLYIETLESILPHMEKVIVEQGNADRVLPYLPVGRRDRP